MADSVYISKNLSRTQLEFIKLLDDNQIQIFRFSEIEALIGKKFENLNEVLENLVHKRLLIRIEKGKFCKPNFRNEYVIGTFINENGAVAYWSALRLHGLTEQESSTVFIQTTHKKNDKTVLGTSYKFVKVAAYKKNGIVSNGDGNLKCPITDVEKTIVDCFDLPQYSGGYVELIRAVKHAHLQSDKLIAYCKAIKNITVTKRIGFLAELFEINDLIPFVKFAKKGVNNKYNLFDPHGLEEGEFISEWKLRLNIKREALLNISKTS